jgi:hypothetical protein
MAQAVPIIGSALLGMGVSQAAKKMGVDPKLAALLGAAAGMGVGSMASGAGSAAASTSSGVVGAAPVYDAFGNVISSAAADASTLASAAMIDPFASSITTGIGVPEVIQPYAEYGSGMTVTPQYDAFGDVISAPEIPFQSEYMIDPFAAQPATPYDAGEFMGTSFTDPTVPALSRAGEPLTYGLDQGTADLIYQDFGDVMDPFDPRLNAQASTGQDLTNNLVDNTRQNNIVAELQRLDNQSADVAAGTALVDPLSGFTAPYGGDIYSPPPTSNLYTLDNAAAEGAMSPFDVAVDKVGNFLDDIPDWAKRQGSSFLYNMAMQLMSSMFKKPDVPELYGGGGQAFAPAFRATTVPFSGAGGGGGLGGNTLLPARQRTRFVPQGVA